MPGRVLVECQACGTVRDPEALAVYPYPDDGICDTPIPPLFELDCQPSVAGDGFRRVHVCHECFHRLDPDMWISQDMWEWLDPVTPFADLERTHANPT